MRPFVLLQLSDLHFGPNSRFAGVDMAELARRCAVDIRDAREALAWKEQVGLVLVTGDVAEAARPKEYESALVFFGALVESLGVPRSSVVFVPGNHDVSWTQCEALELKLRDGLFEKNELRARLDVVKLARFNDMVARFYDPALPRYDDVGPVPARPAAAGNVTALPRGAYVHDFDELAVSVAALDSCEVESHREEDHRGHIGNEQTQAVLAHWLDDATPKNRIRIMTVHHNPVTTIPAAIDEWRGWLRSQVENKKLDADLFEQFAADAVPFGGHERLQPIAADAQVSLLFHGHHHASDAVHAWAWRGKGAPGNTHVISAGSWSLVANKLPAEQPVVMQLVRVDPEAREAQPVLLCYEPRARAAGVVERGMFVPDNATGNAGRLTLSLPATAIRKKARGKSATVASRSPRTSGASAAAALIAAYHARKRDTFVRWDLLAVGASPTVGNSRPVEVNLDDMYIPLRFGEKYDLEHLGSGEPIDAEQLLKRETPLVILGNAGSGKTTWMKRTFRRLIQARTAVPFFLELRAVAASWDKRTNGERTIEALLADEMKACGIVGWEAALAEILNGPGGPRPVLLVDGWDELGDLGERVRTCLSEFRAAHERVALVVSSRPYGEGRPAGSEGFETLEIQPLDDADVQLLTHKFHRRVYGEEEAAAEKSTVDFMARLAVVPEAQALGRTTLLATMMLLLSREGPLPDKRHKLYLACLRNLLDARPALRESEGAQLRRNEWRPDDQDARLRAVSEMAYQTQSDGYKKTSRRPIVRSWEEAAQLLPGAWTREQREGFLLWLINSAGVLVDRSDGAISFAHLSFQEFLSAHYLFATYEGDARVAAVLAHASDLNWGETLRLWAGLIGDLSPEKLAPVLTALRREPHSFWLAGSILADGTGQPADFEAWRQEVCGRLARYAWAAAQQCARAWATSKQHERHTQLAEAAAVSASSAHWLDAIDLADWTDTAQLELALSPKFVEMLDPIASEVALARSRALAGSSWRWPGYGFVMLLRLWPSNRARVSLTLQTLASVGWDRPAMCYLASLLIERARCAVLDQDGDTDLVRHFGQEFAGYFGQGLSQNFGRNFPRDFGRDFGRYLGRTFGRKTGRDLGQIFRLYFSRELVLYSGWGLGLYWERESGLGAGQGSAQAFGREFRKNAGKYFSRDLGPYVGRDWGQRLAAAWGVESSISAMALWEDFAVIEAAAVFGRASGRAAVAHSKLPNDRASELNLFKLACRVSLHHEPATRRLSAALTRYRGDPLWPALARHVARMSTADDRALLEGLAARPEQREGPVSWALRYYVRGDVVMHDGAVITMDEICDELGVPHLPLLEDMAPEIEIDAGEGDE